MTTTKQYDLLNRLQQIASAPGASGVSPVSFGYTYNTANQRIGSAQTDSSYWVYQYDSLGQVTSGKKYWSDGTPVPGQQFEYGFDDIGNRTSTKAGGDSLGSSASLRSATYAANTLNQYTSRTVPNALDVLGASHATNSVTINGSAADYRRGEYFQELVGVVNSATSVWQTVSVTNSGGGSTTGSVFVAKTPELFYYDKDGNLTNDGRWLYTWDAENRLVNMTSTNTPPPGSKLKLDFVYDWQGRRIQKLVSTNNGSIYVAQYTNRFVYDGWNLLAILAPNSSLLSSFVWGLDLSGSLQGAGGVGGLLALNDTVNGVHFCAYDGNGNLAALVKASDGTVSGNWEYGPFGEVLRQSGLMAKANPFRFSTKYQDDESDNLYYGYRSYNPSTGRWLSRDPIAENGGHNLFGFVGNNPLLYIDKHGLDKCCSCWIWRLVKQNKDQELSDMIGERIQNLRSDDLKSSVRVKQDVMLIGKRGGRLGFAMFARFLCDRDLTFEVKADPSDKQSNVSWDPNTGVVNLNSAFAYYQYLSPPDAELFGNFPEVGAAMIAHEFGHAFIGLRDPFNVYIAENGVRKAFGVPRRDRYRSDQEDHPSRKGDGTGLVWKSDNEFDFPWVVSSGAWFGEYHEGLGKTAKFIAEWGGFGCESFP